MLNYRYVINYATVNSILLVAIIYLLFINLLEYKDFRLNSLILAKMQQMAAEEQKQNHYLSSSDFLKQNIQEILNCHSSVIVNEQKFDIVKSDNGNNKFMVGYTLSLESKYLDSIKLFKDLRNIIRRVTFLEIAKSKEDNKNLKIILKTENLVTE